MFKRTQFLKFEKAENTDPHCQNFFTNLNNFVVRILFAGEAIKYRALG